MKKANKNSSILLKGTFALGMANASTQVLGLVLLPVLTIYLSPEDYGIFSMVSLIVTILALVYNPGIMSAMSRLYHDTECEGDRKRLIGSAYIFFLFIPILPIGFGVLLGDKIFSLLFRDFDFYPFGFLALLLAFLTQPSRIWTNLMTLQYRVKKLAIYTVISVVLGLFVTLVFVVGFKMGAMGRVIGMFPPVLLLLFIGIKDVRLYSELEWSFDSISKLLNFGYPLIPALWAYQGLNFVGKYMIEHLSNIEGVGLYSLAVTVASAPMILVMGFRQLWSPIFYENMNLKRYDEIAELVKYFVISMSIICIVSILFSKEGVILLIDDRYLSVIPIVGFLILGTYFNGLLTISNSLLTFNKKLGFISVFAFIAIVVNVLLNFLLIQKFNVLGAAIAFAISYFLFFILGAIHQRKTLLLIQSKGVMVFPVVILFITTALNYYLNRVFEYNSANGLEVGLKFLYLCFIVFLFFKLDFLRIQDVVKFQAVLLSKLKRSTK